MFRHPSLILMLTLSLRSFCLAAQEPADLKPVLPFLDDETVAVMYLDVQRFDPDALMKTLEVWDPLVNFPEFKEGRNNLKKAMINFKQTGAKRVYFVFTLSESIASPGFLLVPLDDGVDAKALASVMFTGEPTGAAELPPNQFGWPEIAKQVDRAVVMGSRRTVNRLADAKAQPQPALEAAFAAAGDSAVRVAIFLPKDFKRVVEELFPTLPQELGGGQTKTLTNAFTHATISLDLPPKLTFKLVIQATDAKSAEAMEDVIGAAMQSAGKQKMVQRDIPDIMQLLPALTPTVDGDKLVLSLDDAKINKIMLDHVSKLAQKARQRALMVKKMSTIRQVLTACYTSAGQGDWPKTLDDLAPRHFTREFLQNNLANYIYIQPNKSAPDFGEVVVIYEKTDAPEAVVGFMDGHVELMKADILRGRLKVAQKK